MNTDAFIGINPLETRTAIKGLEPPSTTIEPATPPELVTLWGGGPPHPPLPGVYTAYWPPL